MLTRKREWSQGFQGWNILDVVASTDASACVLHVLKQQAKAEAKRMGNWALESLAGKLPPLFPEQGTDNRVRITKEWKQPKWKQKMNG